MLCNQIFILLLCFLTWSGQCAKVLVVYPIPAYSHFTLTFRIAKELADRGHQVTAINPYPQKTPIKNYKDVSVEDIIPIFEEFKKTLFAANSFNPLGTMKFAFDLGIRLTEATLNHTNVQKLLNSKETFNVIIIEHFLNDASLGIAHQLNAPVVLIAPMGPTAVDNYLFANPTFSSYIPNIFSDFTKQMSFWERVENFFSNLINDLMIEFYLLPAQREIFKKYIKSNLELDDILYNSSLMLANSHVSVNDAVPCVPNIIEIGGFHVNPQTKLPQDLQTFLDQSKEGVILFSMGSNLKGKDLKPETLTAILKAFTKIKLKVLWKFEENIADAPKNVKIMKWIPQQNVLAHPNTKTFISHGGLLSTIEAVYFGVPIIGIPVFGDQKMNIAKATKNGYAVNIPLPELSEEKLSWALNEVLNNPKYTETVKQRSILMHDQPLKPIDAAVYWIEHVIRHKGAPHLRSAGLDLKWYQRNMIDVIIFLTLVTIVLFVIFYIIIKRILGICFRKKANVTKSKKNK